MIWGAQPYFWKHQNHLPNLLFCGPCEFSGVWNLKWKPSWIPVQEVNPLKVQNVVQGPVKEAGGVNNFPSHSLACIYIYIYAQYFKNTCIYIYMYFLIYSQSCVYDWDGLVIYVPESLLVTIVFLFYVSKRMMYISKIRDEFHYFNRHSDPFRCQGMLFPPNSGREVSAWTDIKRGHLGSRVYIH